MAPTAPQVDIRSVALVTKGDRFVLADPIRLGMSVFVPKAGDTVRPAAPRLAPRSASFLRKSAALLRPLLV
jgi:hypothetical protein